MVSLAKRIELSKTHWVLQYRKSKYEGCVRHSSLVPPTEDLTSVAHTLTHTNLNVLMHVLFLCDMISHCFTADTARS